jgi:predicted 2-oxoglutarate/Fe(II)-dependent dioxygenase YbiX
MPPGEFFARLGLFVATRFLDGGICARLCEEMRDAPSVPGTVRDHADVYTVDECTRRTRVARVSGDSERLVLDRLHALVPELQRHFQVGADTWRAPQFLVYGPGDFFRAHKDSSDAPDAGVIARNRRVSTVIFLNTRSDAPAPGTYGGGELTFYGLLADRRLRDAGLPLSHEVGLLVAFRPETVHAVTAVTHGERYTIATWLVD